MISRPGCNAPELLVAASLIVVVLGLPLTIVLVLEPVDV